MTDQATQELHRAPPPPTEPTETSLSRPLTSPPNAHFRTSPKLSTHSRSTTTSPTKSQNTQYKVTQPWPSLARLPSDVLHRIAHFLQPSISPFASSGEGVSLSSTWIDQGQDLINLSSTCRALWSSTRAMIGRSWGYHRIESSEALEKSGLKRRLATITVPGEDGKLEGTKVEGWDEEEAEDDIPLYTSSLRAQLGRVRPHERMDATRIRHFYIRLSTCPAFLAVQAPLLIKKLKLMTRLESVAFIWKSEDEVVASSPYSTALLHNDVLLALAQIPISREIYLCGFKIARASPTNELVFLPFLPRLTTLVLNACHDNTLNLVKPLRGAVKELLIWRDFARQPRTPPDDWWTREDWTDNLEHLELFGFNGTNGRPFLRTWLDSLFSLRTSIMTNPSSPSLSYPPLRSLCLPEPFMIQNLQTQLLPALASLVHLKRFMIFVWNDRRLQPTLLGDIHAVLPGLEELSLGVDNEKLQWWQGDLRDWGSQLFAFKSLSRFTWNYSPYSGLTYPEMRTHVLRPLLRSISSAPQIHPTLKSIKWFGNDVSLRKEEGEWRWSDDEVFERRLPSWAVMDQDKGLLSVKEEETSDGENERFDGYNSDQVEGVEELRSVKEEEGEEDRPIIEKKRSSRGKEEKEKENESSESSAVEEEKARKKGKKSGARKSLTSLFAQVAKEDKGDKGKGKMRVQDDWEEDVGDDSGFFDLGAKLL